MERIVNGVLCKGRKIPDAWDVRTFEVNGHREVTIRPVVIWEDMGDMGVYKRAAGGFNGAFTEEEVKKYAEQDALEAAERKQRVLKSSARRAKIMCRRVIKAEGFNELLTLTYRENMTDRVQCKVHFKEWFRRMKKAFGTFRFCASFEVQKRGAMHVHVACHKLPQDGLYKGRKVLAWKLGTRIWRDVIGHYKFYGPTLPGVSFPLLSNGLCFVGGKSKFGGGKRRKNMSIAKMASYVSKYILKDYADSPEEKNRYSRSNGTVVPKSTVLRFTACSFVDAICLAFECKDGDVVVDHWLGKFGDSWGLVTEPQCSR